MALDPSTVADGFAKSQGWYAAALLVVVVGPLFLMYRAALVARMEDWKARAVKSEAQLEAQHDRLLITADRVITVASALEKRLPKPRPEKEGGT